MKLIKQIIPVLVSATSFQVMADQPVRVKPIEPIMVTIPAGSFEMGSTERQSTQPIHKVDLKAFSLGKYEVTVREFRQFIEATNYPAPTECRHELDGWFKRASKGDWETNALNTSEFQPVVCINWQTAKAYVDWLAKETGKPYRLPSEAEWEYAARAGTKTDYYFGNDEGKTEICKYANTADIYGENILQRDNNTTYYNWDTGLNNCSDGSAYASIVGMYQPNQHGLHDMISNVLEFTADCHIGNYENAPTDGSPRTDGDCQRRTTRGGSWHWNNFPLTARMSISETFSGGVDGFRIALDGKAPKFSKDTKLFSSALSKAQTAELKRRALIPEFPEKVSNLKIVQSNDVVTLRWDKSNQENVISYRIYRNNLAGNMFKLHVTNLKENSFSEKAAGSHRYEYTVVAVRDHMQSHYAQPVSTEAGWTSIEGKIEAEWASQFEGTSISFSSDENDRGGSVLTGPVGIDENATITYQIDVPAAGEYQFEYRVATPRDTKGFELFANDKKVGSYKVFKTGGYHDWATQNGASIKLKKGKQTLKIMSVDKNWKLNWIRLKLK